MRHSVVLTTPMPTWEETVATYGLTKAEQKFVIRLVDEKLSRRAASPLRTIRRAVSKSVPATSGSARGTKRKKANRGTAGA
jgi:hypothetical protein